MELHAKAWVIDSAEFNEPWFVPEDVIYCDTRNKARQEALSILKWTDLVLKDTDKEPTYLNVPVRRAKPADKYMFNGKIMTLADIDYYERKEKRNKEIDKIVTENPNGFAYIKKGGLYWMPNSCGYTEIKIKAGVYPIEEAAQIVKSSSLDRHETMILIDKEEHNNYIMSHIEDLKSRLL